jgi:rubrerythrin
MDERQFKEVIQFAIEKEIHSFTFYTQASEATKYSGSKQLFSELAKEEEGHRKLIENLDLEKIRYARVEKVLDLRISDYMVEVTFRPDMSYDEILRMAMKMEEHSLKLDHDLKDSTGDEGIKKLFTFLAGEEAKHKLRLEKIYDEEILK